MKSTGILKQLISIPSWVDAKTNEVEIALWIYKFLKKNTNYSVKKQFIDRKRFNVIVQNGNVDTLVTGHMDTVQPNTKWTSEPTKPIERKGKIYGLGSTDMKSGLASILAGILANKDKPNIMYLFYCDEEYDFLGMKKFIREYKNKISPKLIVSADGENLQIGNSCRGLIEMTVKVTGKNGHAARPNSGINAILQSQAVIVSLQDWLRKFYSPELGNSTLNIAYLKGGTNLGYDGLDILLGKEGNVIPDYCEFVVEIRTASSSLYAQKVAEYIKNISKKKGLTTIEIAIRHDLGSWITETEDIKKFVDLSPNKQVINSQSSGYIDIQMLWEAFGKVPTFYFGPGEKGMAHKANEFVTIASMMESEKFFDNLLKAI